MPADRRCTPASCLALAGRLVVIARPSRASRYSSEWDSVSVQAGLPAGATLGATGRHTIVCRFRRREGVRSFDLLDRMPHGRPRRLPVFFPPPAVLCHYGRSDRTTLSPDSSREFSGGGFVDFVGLAGVISWAVGG